jgi:hypothetical protein
MFLGSDCSQTLTQLWIEHQSREVTFPGAFYLDDKCQIDTAALACKTPYVLWPLGPSHPLIQDKGEEEGTN